MRTRFYPPVDDENGPQALWILMLVLVFVDGFCLFHTSVIKIHLWDKY